MDEEETWVIGGAIAEKIYDVISSKHRNLRSFNSASILTEIIEQLTDQEREALIRNQLNAIIHIARIEIIQETYRNSTLN